MSTTLENVFEPLPNINPVAAMWPQQADALLVKVAQRVHDSVCAADQNLGHLQAELLRGSHEVFRQRLEPAAQQKADATPPLCPPGQNKLSRLTEGHRPKIPPRFGPIHVWWVRGYCRRSRQWRFAADALLGWPDQGTQSPAVQEMAALTVSKLSVGEAQPVVERLAGGKIAAATLGRANRPPGPRVQPQRQKLDQKMSPPEGRSPQDRDFPLQPPLQPFTLIIELDAWNLRERDDWARARGYGPKVRNLAAGLGLTAALVFV